MQSHQKDLRSELRDLSESKREKLVTALGLNWRDAELDALDRLLCAFAEQLTTDPSKMRAEDLEGLRRGGLDEEAIHCAIQVVAYFNYINRIADAVHVDLEEDMDPYPETRA